MMKAQQATAAPGNLKVYKDQMRQVQNLRDGYANPKTGKWVAGFNEMAMATGRFGVETVKTVSATERLTDSIMKQKLGFREALRQMGTFKNAWREQAALQKATAMQWTGSMTGKNTTDLYVPKNVGKELDSFRTKYGYINQAIGSIAHQTINWGKNTQWAGRQIMVGIGVPLAMAGGLMAKLAYEADKQLTRITKVYDSTDFSKMGITDPTDQEIAKTLELQQVRKNAMEDAGRMAKSYGATLTDTLKLEADLAATGLKGNELRATTEQVTRIATLGELDHQTALDMTITLMSTLNQKAGDLANTFNFMNAIENATSLSTQDFAEALPRMAGALTGLGVSVQQMGVMMTALKEGGVNAAEGANALKSATTRVLRPTQAAQAAFAGMGITIEDVVARNGGNLFKILNDLGTKMEGFGALQRQQAIGALFGTYQFNRLNVVMNNLADVTSGKLPDGFSQTATAAKIAQQATSDWAAVADKELMQQANSVSGRFKRAIETVKVELAKMGEPILSALVPIAEFIGRLISGFNGMPGIFKKILAGLAVLGLVAGPLIMLIGLFGNLAGNAVKLLSNIANLGLRFKAMTADQRATELMTRRATSAFNSEASSIALLTIEMKKMLSVLEQQAVQQKKNALLAGGMSPRAAAAAVAQRAPNGRFENDAQRQARLAAEAARQTERTRVSMMGVASAAAGLGMGVMAINNMRNGTDSILGTMMNIAMVAASIQMTGLGKGLASLMKKETWTRLGTHVSGAFTGALGKVKAIGLAVKTAAMTRWTGMLTSLTSATGIMSKMGVLMRAMMGPAGWIALGIGVLIAGIMYFNKKQDESYKKQQEINRAAQKYADIMGFEYKAGSILGNAPQPDTQAYRLDMLKKLKETTPEVVKALEEAGRASDNFASAFNLAMQQAIKVATHGGTASMAREMFQTALQAAGLSETEIDELSIRYDSIDIGNPEALKNEIASQVRGLASGIHFDIINADGDITAGITEGLRSQVSALGTEFSNLMGSLGDDLGAGADAFRALDVNINEMFQSDYNQWFKGLEAGFQKKIKDAGITNIGELQAYMNENPGVFNVELSGMNPASQQGLEALRKQYKSVIGEILKQMESEGYVGKGFVDKFMSDTSNFNPNWGKVVAGLGRDYISLEDAQAGYNGAIKESIDNGEVWSDQEKLAQLNVWRRARGMDDATHYTQGFADKLLTAAEAAQALEDALAFDPKTYIITAEQGTSMLKDSFSTAMGYVYGRAEKLAQSAEQSSQARIQRSGEARQKGLDDQGKAEDKYYDERGKALDTELKAEEKAFNDSWDAREKALEDQIKAEGDAFDARIKLIQDEIDKLDEADKERQKLFEREKQRISRMSELHNNGIDFNMALNSGNLDEAAKIYSNNSATVRQWGVDDELARLDDASEERKKTLELRIKEIEGEKDARLAALDAEKEGLGELRKFEDEQMKLRQDARKADLDAEKAAAKEKLDADKEASREATQSRLDNDKKEWDSKKDTLERTLNEIKASTPRTMEEYNNQIAQIEKAYADYGVDLVNYGNEWTGIIGDGLLAGTAEAAASLQNEIGWQQMGTYISQQVGAGTGLTMESIKTFLQTGKFPEGPVAAAQPWVNTQSAAQDANMKKMGYTPIGGGKYRAPGGAVLSAYHDGGQIGEKEGPSWSQKDRAGIPRSSSLYPSEYHAVLKHGEFIVNAKDARKNIALLRAINGGGMIPAGDPGLRGVNAAQYFEGLSTSARINGIHHQGGLIDSTAGVAAGFGNVLLSVTDIVANKAAELMRSKMLADAPAMPYIGGTGGNVKKVLDTARREQGKPYIWGGAGPAGSDCSGFMNIIQNAVYGKNPPYGRRWATGSFEGGREIDGWKRGGSARDVFRIGVDPNSHVVGNFAGINVESGSGHGPMVGGGALGPNSFGRYKYYLPAANNLPQLKNGGRIKYDNTLANLHKDETVLKAPLTKAFEDNVASGFGNEYNLKVSFNGPVNSEIDVTKAVKKAIEEIENKNGRKRVIK